MKIAIVGGGPAGLYCAYLLKRLRREAQIRVFEQNPADATFGFGVVFSDQALGFLRDDDPETYDLITPQMEMWRDLTLRHQGQVIRIDGIGFSAIGRLRLLRLLQSRLVSVGLRPRFEHRLESLDEVADADVVVGADGVNSLVRSALSASFGTAITHYTNKFAWYGTRRPFQTLTQTFVRTAEGVFNAHHYRYAPDMSTFIVETNAPTWQRVGFADMDDEQTRRYCERVFAEVLDGQRLVSNKSVWRGFPRIRNERWTAGNVVLVGDALRTAHFSIGSGTRLALEDVIALVRALDERWGDVRAAFDAYETRRRPSVEKLLAAADSSAAWYERFEDHMALRPWDFAWSYITRSGRVDVDRLRAISPHFLEAYEASRSDARR
ncbi:MAG: NAD(P)-binding protein [Gammaproteobacteria bacterium]|nr:NAD(P)-binding protein [Gammaproteobacteria bacterium]NIR85651.1 NAD(P)-binding protein [Gammaproteobacteria bacterium]NIR90139.1 NAD(P)-binding protein [Gammaproteobacteria bacterium]NIU06785.1 NAD(P)-binding protein [Gammaproteobacteria bacterium]NIV53718.1 NAD(P)-binding protein [Gammaproteobacteria bacterium]